MYPNQCALPYLYWIPSAAESSVTGPVCYHRPMRGSLVGLALVAVAGVGGALTYASYTTERDFVRLVAAGDAAVASGQRVEALEAYSGALALVPDAVVAYLKRGRLHHEEGEHEAAQRDLRRAAELDPSATRPLEWLGDISLELGRDERAADYFRQALAIDEGAARLWYKRGLAEYRAERRDEAAAALQSALRLDDTLTDARFLLGLCERDAGDWQTARDTLERVVRAQPAAAGPREALAEVYTELGDQQRTLDQLEALATLDPRPERSVAVGLAHARAGREAQAVLVLSRAAERYPEVASVYAALGTVWLEQAQRQGDQVALAKAIEALTNATARGAASSTTLADLGRAWALAGNLAEAERVLRQAVTRLPVAAAAFLELANVAERQEHPQEARDALLQHLALLGDTRPAGALAQRVAELSLRVSDAGQALHWATRAMTERGPSPVLLAVVGEAALLDGDVPRAEQAVTEGLRLAPADRRLLALRRRLAAERTMREDQTGR